MSKVNVDLNNAYYIKSYYDLSTRLDKEFPLFHFSFYSGYGAWDRLKEKGLDHESFMLLTNSDIRSVYDSIAKDETRHTNTTNFIKENAGSVGNSQLRDSLRTLPVTYCPNSCYFIRSVYAMAKADPVVFYQILEDNPSNKTIVHYAVSDDKELIKRLSAVDGYNSLRREFIKDRRYDRSIPYRVFGAYAVIAGLITWLIISQ